jgi:hypothetical protein
MFAGCILLSACVSIALSSEGKPTNSPVKMTFCKGQPAGLRLRVYVSCLKSTISIPITH